MMQFVYSKLSFVVSKAKTEKVPFSTYLKDTFTNFLLWMTLAIEQHSKYFFFCKFQ